MNEDEYKKIAVDGVVDRILNNDLSLEFNRHESRKQMYSYAKNEYLVDECCLLDVFPTMLDFVGEVRFGYMYDGGYGFYYRMLWYDSVEKFKQDLIKYSKVVEWKPN